MNAWQESYKYLLAWLVAILLLTLVNKSRLGHVIIYYWLWLLILFLLVTQYKQIQSVLLPLSNGEGLGVINTQGGET